MIKLRENYWLLEGIANETAKMVDLWESLTDKGIHGEDFAAVCRWNPSFKDILQSLSKQCDEMEEALKELDDDAYQDWLLSFPDDSPPEAPEV
jgi:hypothetical protein